MTIPDEKGFSLVELATVLVVLGLLLGFSIPSFQRISATYQLQSSAEGVAAQLRLAREKALATGEEQPLHFPYTNAYHLHYPSGISTTWTLPRGVTFATSTVGAWYHMKADGRCAESGLIILRNARGARDTVSVQLSGLVLNQ